MPNIVAFATLSACLSLACTSASAETHKPVQASVAQACAQDLAYLPDFLLANDTGAADNRRFRGEPAIAAAQERASREAAAATTNAECEKILDRYLAAWREGHLWVETAAKAPDGDPAAVATPRAKRPQASVRWLSKTTVLLNFPTFHPSAEAQVRELFKNNRNRLAQTPHWIIDVRRNDGGSDSTYHPIVQAVVGNSLLHHMVEFLATPANMESTSRVCEMEAPGDADCVKWTQSMVEVMRAAPPGSYVLPPGLKSAVIRVEPEPPARKRPQRVAVLIDKDCGSSCEQFALAMRQSWNVKLMGRRTYGALDYSNLRPHPLPSGQRVLQYATSRSLRLPHLPVDAVGVLPDVLLTPPADEAGREREVEFVRALLEGRPMDPPPGR
ncbi:MAG: hypothetical protein RL328_885 [Acidobacteriota bacterium]|jgi:hypothetical protein